jgi:YfiH family protein
VNFVQVKEWKRFAWLRHGFSTRVGGASTVYGGRSLNLGFTREDDPILVRENRRELARAVTGLDTAELPITLRQVHAAAIHTIQEGSPLATWGKQGLLEGDGLMTKLPGVLLGIQTADCVPVILIAPESRVVAVFHAGWRGTVAEIVAKGVALMGSEYGVRPKDLLAAVGPSIGACCYTVGEEVRTAFGATFTYADQLFQGDRLNLWEANRRQLEAQGLLPAHIVVVGECTGCFREPGGDRRYFSHRIDHRRTGRMMTLAGIAPAG